MKNLLALALFAAACGKSAPATDTVALGDSGFSIDVPKGWTVEVPMKGFYDFKASGRNAHGAPQIMESEMSLGTVDEAVKNHCEGLEVTGKDALPAGGYWVTC